MDTAALLRRYGIQPSKGLGQHFLAADWVYDAIVSASDLLPQDVVLEVGPGLGTLTRRLAERAGRVLAVELDRKMLTILTETLADRPNVEVVQGDILALDTVTELCTRLGIAPAALRYKVAANLPYYITSNALRHLLGAAVRPELLTVMVQREVAERILAQPGDLSLLAVGVQVYGRPELICHVPPSAFIPPPKVASAVLRIQVHPAPLVSEERLDAFFAVVRAGFGQKRKQLHNSLVAGLHADPRRVGAALAAADIAPTRRAQTLSLEEWARLMEALAG